MKEWYEALAPRERIIVTAGAVLVIPILLWAFAWEPVSTSVGTLRTDVKNDRELLAWMQQSSVKIKQANKQPGSKKNQHISLINAVESTARQSGLRKNITSLNPTGEDKINIRIKDIAFDDLILWQGRLQREFSINSSQVSITGTDKSGLVNARITYKR